MVVCMYWSWSAANKWHPETRKLIYCHFSTKGRGYPSSVFVVLSNLKNNATSSLKLALFITRFLVGYDGKMRSNDRRTRPSISDLSISSCCKLTAEPWYIIVLKKKKKTDGIQRCIFIAMLQKFFYYKLAHRILVLKNKNFFYNLR